MVFHPVIRDLALVVQTNVQFMQVRSVSKNINMISEISSDQYVYADQKMLDLIIRNLLSNAIKFTECGGTIRIKADYMEEEGTMVVSVCDTGTGIPAHQADSLLQDTYPVSSLGTAGEQGVGLGLTLCKEFVHLNGGEIWFKSILGQGSTFFFSLPTPTKVSGESIHQDRV